MSKAEEPRGFLSELFILIYAQFIVFFFIKYLIAILILMNRLFVFLCCYENLFMLSLNHFGDQTCEQRLTRLCMKYIK